MTRRYALKAFSTGQKMHPVSIKIRTYPAFEMTIFAKLLTNLTLFLYNGRYVPAGCLEGFHDIGLVLCPAGRIKPEKEEVHKQSDIPSIVMLM